MGTWTNSEDPDEMQHNAAFHQGLHCLLRLKQPSGTEIHHNFENSTFDPLKYTMGWSHTYSINVYMGKSIRIQRVKVIPEKPVYISFNNDIPHKNVLICSKKCSLKIILWFAKHYA